MWTAFSKKEKKKKIFFSNDFLPQDVNVGSKQEHKALDFYAK